MKRIEEFLEGVQTMGIAGHVRPDGDAVGSCMGLYLYIKKNYPQIRTDVYLDHPAPVFGHISNIDDYRTREKAGMIYDVFVTCDVSAPDRISVGAGLFDTAVKTVCIDHHKSNPGFADINHVCPEVSSCSEVLYTLMDPEKVDRSTAEALYTGMIHDTGVFQYSSTTPRTLRIAAELIEKGIDFSKIIEESFYQKTYIQNQVMGRVLAESIMLMDGKCIVGYIRKKDMAFYGITSNDLEGIVAQLRTTKGTEVAIFLYELETQLFKVSLRSNGRVDVSKTAAWFGGGGHVRAAGCELSGSMYDVINNITEQLENQVTELGL